MFGQSGGRSVRGSLLGVGAARQGLYQREFAPRLAAGAAPDPMAGGPEAGGPEAAREGAGPPADAPAAGGGRKPSILVADDNDGVVESLALLLELSGYAVIKAYDGLQAVAAVERERPDIVLLDIGMPGLDGHAACRRMRALPQGERLRIIALSGSSLDTDGDCRRSAEAGFDCHLVKPVESAALFKLLGCG